MNKDFTKKFLNPNHHDLYKKLLHLQIFKCHGWNGVKEIVSRAKNPQFIGSKLGFVLFQ
jgi:hypothetical protein